jgi:hypothetical protein
VEGSVFSGSTRESVRSEGNEVEDAFNDIFMLNALGACGTSSPRRIKSHVEKTQGTKESKKEDDDSTSLSDGDNEASGALVTSENASIAASEKSSTKITPKRDDDFYETMMSMVEGGFGAVSAAFGFAYDPDADGDPIGPTCGAVSSKPPDNKRTNNSNKTARRDSNGSGKFEGVIDSVSDYILGTEKSESSEVSSASDICALS